MDEIEYSILKITVINKVAEALQHALKQVTNETERRLAAQEFWHSLNRKKIIPNYDVEKLIQLTS